MKFDVYTCVNCGFMNDIDKGFIIRDKDKLCPYCGHDDQDLVKTLDIEEETDWLN